MVINNHHHSPKNHHSAPRSRHREPPLCINSLSGHQGCEIQKIIKKTRRVQNNFHHQRLQIQIYWPIWMVSPLSAAVLTSGCVARRASRRSGCDVRGPPFCRQMKCFAAHAPFPALCPSSPFSKFPVDSCCAAADDCSRVTKQLLRRSAVPLASIPITTVAVSACQHQPFNSAFDGGRDAM